METHGIKAVILIGLTFLVAMMLAILPLPEWAVWFRPVWVFMVLLSWMIAAPDRVGVIVAFISGLFLDLLTGTVLGQHAFVFTLIAYFFIRFHPQIRSFPGWQQLILVCVSTIVYLLLQYWIMVLCGQSPTTWKYWLPILTTCLIWPWLRLVLNDYQHRFNLT